MDAIKVLITMLGAAAINKLIGGKKGDEEKIAKRLKETGGKKDLDWQKQLRAGLLEGKAPADKPAPFFDPDTSPSTVDPEIQALADAIFRGDAGKYNANTDPTPPVAAPADPTAGAPTPSRPTVAPPAPKLDRAADAAVDRMDPGPTDFGSAPIPPAGPSAKDRFVATAMGGGGFGPKAPLADPKASPVAKPTRAAITGPEPPRPGPPMPEGYREEYLSGLPPAERNAFNAKPPQEQIEILRAAFDASVSGTAEAAEIPSPGSLSKIGAAGVGTGVGAVLGPKIMKRMAGTARVKHAGELGTGRSLARTAMRQQQGRDY